MSTKLQWMSLSWSLVLTMLAFGQPPKESYGDSDPNEAHTIILSPGRSKPLQFLYAASVRASIDVRPKDLVQTLQIQLRVLQGEGDSVSLGLRGEGEVTDVQGTCIAGWGVRSSGGERYLDLQLAKVRRGEKRNRSHSNEDRCLTRDDRVGAFDTGPVPGSRFPSRDSLFKRGFRKVVQAAGFAPIVSKGRIDRLQTTTGGKLVLSVDRQSALPPDIDMEDVTLVGQLHPSGKSIAFEWRGIAQVRSAGAKIHGYRDKWLLANFRTVQIIVWLWFPTAAVLCTSFNFPKRDASLSR